MASVPADAKSNMNVEHPTDAVRALFQSSFPTVERFAELLVAEGELRGLIGPRELPRLWSRHIVNSAAVLDFIPEHAQMLDIGSGAGFPGIVVAIARPDVDVHLVEPMARRCDWLEHVRSELDIKNVTIHEVRAEQLHGEGQSDIVTARAVANLKKLIPLAMPLVMSGGSMLALKGRKAADEVSASRPLFRRFQVDKVDIHEVASPMEDESTRVVELHKRR
ncbi:MAG: 16S rRNA (guanine(527)-N(7))-methyltransferase RsmG [Actinomycetaceae bacterium]|nr:16S rRNA (guanine(527)-N(7))-methyltransferase RsmG [Actinomycetaceae bacterium]